MNWYFGNGAGLDFGSGEPVVDTLGQTQAVEAVFTMSDTCGSLLFYGAEDTYDSLQDTINGIKIWTKEHTLMANGILSACCTPTQSICVPQPENDSIYYIFYTDQGGSLNGRFLYATLNINKNGGLGEIITKDIALLDSFATEKVAATKHCNGVDYWIVSKVSGQREQLGDTSDGNQISSWLLSGSNYPIYPAW